MIFLPDTNVWIRFLNPGKNLVADRFLAADPSTIWLCAVVKDRGGIAVRSHQPTL